MRLLLFSRPSGTWSRTRPGGCDYIKRRGCFGLDTGFIGHTVLDYSSQWRYLQLTITVCSAIAISHSLQVHYIMYWDLLVCCSFTSPLAPASNGGRSPSWVFEHRCTTATTTSYSHYPQYVMELPPLVHICAVGRYPNSWLLLKFKFKFKLCYTATDGQSASSCWCRAKLKLYCDRRPVGQFVLVSGARQIKFAFSVKSKGWFISKNTCSSFCHPETWKL
jgi:hypothetical protein